MSSGDPFMNEPELPALTDVPYDQGIPPDLTDVPALPPPRRPHPNVWWSILWMIGFIIAVNGFAVAVAAAIIIAKIAVAPNSKQAADELLAPEHLMSAAMVRDVWAPTQAASQLAILLIACLSLRIVAGRDWPRQVALRVPGGLHTFLAVLAVPAMWIVAEVVDHYAQKIPGLPHFGIEPFIEAFLGLPFVFVFLMIAVQPALGEEFWCRAFLGRGLVGRHGYVLGVVLTSIWFGIMHLEPRQVLYAPVLGIGLHYAYLTSRSLLIPMLMHFLNNGASITIAWLVHRKLISDIDIDFDSPAVLARLLGATSLLVAALAWASYRSRARIVAPDGGPAPWQPAYPGVEYPPPGSGAVVVRPFPGVAPLLAVGVALATFVGTVCISATVKP
jgi:membrane protease YdiL (CAAX protease family)